MFLANIIGAFDATAKRKPFRKQPVLVAWVDPTELPLQYQHIRGECSERVDTVCDEKWNGVYE